MGRFVDADAWIPTGGLPQQGYRFVLRAVVDGDDFVVRVCLSGEAGETIGQESGGVVDRQEDGDQGTRRGAHPTSESIGRRRSVRARSCNPSGRHA